MPIRVGIADGHAVVRRYVRGHHPDALVLDLSLPEGLSVDAIPEIRSEFPDTQIVVLWWGRPRR